MRDNNKIKMVKTVAGVERERERELYSNEISFINYAKKLKDIDIIKRMDYIAIKIGYMVCPFCV